MDKKFELVYDNVDERPQCPMAIENELTSSKLKLYRIRALIDIPSISVKKGDLGGWVENEENLDQNGACWISRRSIVCGGAKIKGNTRIMGEILIKGNIVIDGESYVDVPMKWFGCKIIGNNINIINTRIYPNRFYILGDNIKISNSHILGNYPRIDRTKDQLEMLKLKDDDGQLIITDSKIHDRVRITGNVTLTSAKIFDRAEIKGNATVTNSEVHDNAVIKDNATIVYSDIQDHVIIAEQVTVKSNIMFGYTVLCGNNEINDGNNSNYNKYYISIDFTNTSNITYNIPGKFYTLRLFGCNIFYKFYNSNDLREQVKNNIMINKCILSDIDFLINIIDQIFEHQINKD